MGSTYVWPCNSGFGCSGGKASSVSGIRMMGVFGKFQEVLIIDFLPALVFESTSTAVATCSQGCNYRCLPSHVAFWRLVQMIGTLIRMLLLGSHQS